MGSGRIRGNMPDDEKLRHYDILELIAKLGNYKGIEYEIDEIKDGRIVSIRNVRIEKIELTDK